MKKLALILIAVATCLNMAGCNTSKTKGIIKTNPIYLEESVENEEQSDINKYEINVELDVEDRVLYGKTNVSYINNENISLDKIYFHIYPNAYKRKDTSPVPPEDFETVYWDGFKPGSIDIDYVTSNDESLQYNIQGNDETILEINLDNPLEPGNRVEVSIGFKISIPKVYDRLGYGNNCYNFGNWYPIAAVYDDTGWNLDPYYAMGDPFYSDISDYNVSITVPKDFTVAATGEIVDEKLSGNKRNYTFKENYVRDFAWVTSDKFNVDVENVDGIDIKSYYIDGSNNRNELALNTAKNSIKIFNSKYGKYPYKTLSVVGTCFISGMEYPGIVFINSDYYNDNTDDYYLEVTIAHEIAHQWWYAVVGNDEVDEAWVDESLAAYSEVVYYDNTESREYGDSYMEKEYTMVYNSYKKRIQSTEKILQPVTNFKNLNDYAVLVYYKGAMMHDAIRDTVGDKTFFKILQTYYNEYKFKNASSQDFIGIVERVTGKEWDDFFNKWLLNE